MSNVIDIVLSRSITDLAQHRLRLPCSHHSWQCCQCCRACRMSRSQAQLQSSSHFQPSIVHLAECQNIRFDCVQLTVGMSVCLVHHQGRMASAWWCCCHGSNRRMSSSPAYALKAHTASTFVDDDICLSHVKPPYRPASQCKPCPP